MGLRKGMVDALDNCTAGPVVLHPNTCMDLPADASFEFVEIQARSLPEHRARLQILDDTMRRDLLIPSSSGGAARTELEISLTASQPCPGAIPSAQAKLAAIAAIDEQLAELTPEQLQAPIEIRRFGAVAGAIGDDSRRL